MRANAICILHADLPKWLHGFYCEFVFYRSVTGLSKLF